MIDFERRARLAAEIASEQPTEVLRLKDISDPTKAYVIGHRRGSLWAFAELENWRASILEDNEKIKADIEKMERERDAYKQALEVIVRDHFRAKLEEIVGDNFRANYWAKIAEQHCQNAALALEKYRKGEIDDLDLKKELQRMQSLMRLHRVIEENDRKDKA